MIARTVAWLCVMTAALPLAAQTTTMPAEAVPSTQPALTEGAPWTGVVTGVNVYVRSGPGEQAYPCTRLSAPDQVTVVGRTDGWLRIAAPKGCFSVIGKAYVQSDAAGKTGTVTGDNVWVRAGGDLRTSNFIAVQRQLNHGETVQIIGDAGEYYSITPPQGAYFYISARYVRQVGAPAVSEMEALAAEHPAELKTVPEATPTAPEEPSRATKLEAFKRAEAVLQEEFAKPLEQRDLQRALIAYQTVPLSADDPLKLYVDARITFIRQSMDEVADLQRVKELAKTTADKQAEYEAMIARLQKVVPPPVPARLPVARGVLQPSVVFAGTAAIGRRYMLIDLTSGQVTAYIQSANADIDLDKYVGMDLVIFGNAQFDVELQRNVVDPDEIQVVGPGGTLPSPPKPVIRVRRPASMPATASAPVPPPIPAPVPVPAPAPAPAPVAAPTPPPPPAPAPAPAPRPTTAPAATTEGSAAESETPPPPPSKKLPVAEDKPAPTSQPLNEDEYQ